MSQQQPQLQQMDYAEMSRKFPGMIFNHNPYSLAQKVVVPPPQQAPMYPMNGMAPNLIPIPMMPTMQMRAPDMDYNRWMTDNYQGAQQQIYCGPQYDMSQQQPMQQMAMSQPQGMSRMSSHGSMGRISTSRSPTPSIDMCSSPRFGPGPPIVTSERVKGPRGCNLFVFHLPNEITNWDLYLLFRRFGTILSVHTMVNKSTGLSKGFGFVSYSAHQEAHAAITEMDGFRLGKKRLKVQLKRSQDDNDDEDDGSDVFYPGNLQQQQQQQQQQYGDGPPRTGSYGSFYGDSTSGQTTRASTPTGGRGRGDSTATGGGGGGLHHTVSGDANDANGYFHGVNSATHSPAEEGATTTAPLELTVQLGKLSVVEGGGCIDAPAEVVTSDHTIIPPPPPSVPASKTKTPFVTAKPHAATASAAGGNGEGSATANTAVSGNGANRKK